MTQPQLNAIAIGVIGFLIVINYGLFFRTHEPESKVPQAVSDESGSFHHDLLKECEDMIASCHRKAPYLDDYLRGECQRLEKQCTWFKYNIMFQPKPRVTI